MIVVLNCETLAPSEYALAWTDVVQMDGEVYGLSAAGVRTLAGDIEASARPSLTTGELSLLPAQAYNVSRAYLDLETETGVTLTATAAGGAASLTREYPCPGREGGGRARTIPLGRGPRGQDWTLNLAAARGGAWALKALEVVVERPVRRR